MNIRSLEILGVLPEFRSYGIGRQLLRAVEVETGELVPRQGIYVEATSQENVSMSRSKTAVTHRRCIHWQAAMYQRWGFELKAEAHYESEQGNFDTWRLFKESHH